MMVRAIWLLTHRPQQFWSTLRQYGLFWRTRLLARLMIRASSGIELERNVRLQRLRVVSAERPSATIRIGENTVVYEHARIQAYGHGRLSIGRGCIIGDARIYSRGTTRIGDRVVTSWNVFIQDFDPHPIDPDARAIQMKNMVHAFSPYQGKRPAALPLDFDFSPSEVTIGDDVWIGANVSILKGAYIGAGSIVATGAVVPAGQYPPRSILAGVPAKVVKSL